MTVSPIPRPFQPPVLDFLENPVQVTRTYLILPFLLC